MGSGLTLLQYPRETDMYGYRTDGALQPNLDGAGLSA
jgi:hypothetical protein